VVEFYGQLFLFCGLDEDEQLLLILLIDDLQIFCEFIALLLGANIIQFYYSDERNTDHLFL